MNEDRNHLDPLVSRLKALGEHDVDHDVATRVMARVRANRASWFGVARAKVAAAAAGGFLVGSVGLASAGTLPAPAQDVAHAALGAVGVDVPPGHDRYNGPECGGTYANHGQYVEAHQGDPAAGRSPCGKPSKAVARGQGKGRGQSGASTGGRHGPPPWAGGGQAKKAGKATKAGDPGASTSESAPSSTAAPTTSTSPTTHPPLSATSVPATTTTPTTTATTTSTTTSAPATTTSTTQTTTTTVP